MSKIKTIIVENEAQHSSYLLNKLKENYNDFDVLALCTNYTEAVEQIKKHEPELVFLDVELDSRENGLDVLKATKKMAYEIIFTTAHNDYAKEAIRFTFWAYLLKPYGLSELRNAVERYMQYRGFENEKRKQFLIENLEQNNLVANLRIAIPTSKEIIYKKLSEIIYAEANDTKSLTYCYNQLPIESNKGLKYFEELLSSKNFARVHKRFLINNEHVVKYEKGVEGGLAHMSNGHTIPVSRNGRSNFENDFL